MFFNKSHRITALEKEIIRLQCRIAELVDKLCPCENHDWKKTGTEYKHVERINDLDIIYKYKCKRCGKTMESMVKLHD